MIAPPANTQIWIAAGVTDMRRGFIGLSALVQAALEQAPLSGHVFAFRGRRGRSDQAALVRWRRSLSIFELTGFTLHLFRIDPKVLIVSLF
jgi:transposase